MRLIDQQHLQKPYYGVYRMWEWLYKDKGYQSISNESEDSTSSWG